MDQERYIQRDFIEEQEREQSLKRFSNTGKRISAENLKKNMMEYIAKNRKYSDVQKEIEGLREDFTEEEIEDALYHLEELKKDLGPRSLEFAFEEFDEFIHKLKQKYSD